MMMGLGYSPELTQVAYRVADSTTNIISPLMPYFAIVIAFAQKYDKKSWDWNTDLHDDSLLHLLYDCMGGNANHLDINWSSTWTKRTNQLSWLN